MQSMLRLLPAFFCLISKYSDLEEPIIKNYQEIVVDEENEAMQEYDEMAAWEEEIVLEPKNLPTSSKEIVETKEGKKNRQEIPRSADRPRVIFRDPTKPSSSQQQVEANVPQDAPELVEAEEESEPT